jgi:hypothetical protein
MVKRMGPDSVVPNRAFRDWPLFREYRKSEDFQLTFEEAFEEPLNLFSVNAQEIETLPNDELPPLEDLPPVEELPSVEQLERHLFEDRQFLEDELPPIEELQIPLLWYASVWRELWA